MSLLEALLGLLIAVGVVGVLVPVLPGTALVAVAVLAWAIQGGTTGTWVFALVALGLLVLGTVVKYAVPGRRLRQSGIPARTQLVGALVGIIGFFLIPVVGVLIGFVLGIYLAERARLGAAGAWPSTKQALRAVGLSLLIELAAAVLAALTWVVGVVAT
jgi:uncharacterized protein YqgC (DUF456 family)